MSNDSPKFEEVTPDDDQTRIISPEELDPLSEPAKPIPPAPKMKRSAPSEFQEKTSSLPDPAPAPKEAKTQPGGSKLRLTKKRSGAQPEPKPQPIPQPMPDKKPDPVSFELPKEPPASQRQPAYKKPVEDDEGGDSGGIGAALGLGAMLLSIAALLVALGVISVGSKEVTSSQIAPGAVGQEQIFDGAVTSEKLQPELITELKGQVGPTGSTGPRGPKGKRGAVGAAGITNVSTVERTIVGTAASEVSTIASCKAGEIVIGGGGTVSGATGSVALTSSEPVADLGGWRAAAAQTGETKASWDLSVWAICATPSQELRKSVGG